MTTLKEEDIELGNIEEDQTLLIRDRGDGGNQQQFIPKSLKHNRTCTDEPRDKRDSSSHPKQKPSPAASDTNDASTSGGSGNFTRTRSPSDNRIKRLNTQLLEAVESRDVKEVKRLLKAGASPNATCRLNHISACHLAALEGGDTLALLLESGAVKERRDKHGRTPLHLAAWSGAAKEIAILLNFPVDLQNKVANDKMLIETKADVEKLRPEVKQMANMPCEIKSHSEYFESWEDSMAHSCIEMNKNIPFMDVGWTPLHAASSNARAHCTRLLLAAGAETNIGEHKDQTPLDVAGSAYYHTHDITVERFREVIKTLFEAGSKLNTDQFQTLHYFDSPLHVAVELLNLDVIKELLDAGAPVTCLDRNGLTPLHLCVKKQLKKHLQFLVNHNNTNLNPIVDAKDKNGDTILHAAVKISWMPGVCVTLEAGADVTNKNLAGHTPLHSAARQGNLDVLKEILNIAKQNNAIDCDEEGITPLMSAVINEHIKCVEEILNAGASIKKCAPRNMSNVLHIAAKNRCFNILKVLLEHDDAIDILNDRDSDNYTPILYAVDGNHVECFQLLFSKHKNICSQNNTLYDVSELFIKAISFDRIKIANELIEYDKAIVHVKADSHVYYNPFEYAIRRGSTEILKLLLKNGASLLTDVGDPAMTGLASIFTDFPISIYYTENNALELYGCQKIDKPTEFIENIFDEFIYTNKIYFNNTVIDRNIQDPKCIVTVDYGIFLPEGCEREQMKVLKALLETGNKNNQRRLLLHPLVESFIYLKWKALSSLYYLLVAFLGVFVGSINMYIICFYYYKDTKKPVLGVFDPDVWKTFVYATVIFELIVECVNIRSKKCLYSRIITYSLRVVFMIIVLVLPSIMTEKLMSDSEWPRHIATVVLLISWLEMMIMLSRIPCCGYYVLMFRKVALKLVTILLIFSILIAAFAFSFMIQFHSKQPFDNVWTALLKTMVMMTSELEYSSTFGSSNDTKENPQLTPEVGEDLASIIFRSILFVIFLILSAIVLMNLILGVAVTDLHNLVLKRKIKRHEDLIMFLDSLEALAYHRFSPNYLNRNRNVESKIEVWPSEPGQLKSKIPKSILKAVIDNIQAQHELKDDSKPILTHEEKLKQMFALVKNRESVNRFFKNIPGWKNESDCEKLLTPLDQINIEVQQIHVKLDQMSSKMKSMKQTIGRLESKH